MRMKWPGSWLMNSGTAPTISRETNTWSSGNRCNGSVSCTVKGTDGNWATLRCVVNRNLCIELIKVNILGSDIDIAVYGGDFDSFYWDIKEKVHSLLSFDVVEADKPISEELKQEIEKDGVIIYEKA